MSFINEDDCNDRYDLFSTHYVPGFPDGLEDKASAHSAGDPGSIHGSGRSPGEGNGPWRRVWQPTPVFLPGESP